MKRVLLIIPPTGKYIREDRCQTPIDHLKTVALRPPIDLMYAAAGFEDGGAECRLVDFPAEELGWEDFRNILEDFRPDILVLSITTPSLEKDAEAARKAKEILPKITTIAKGAHFNILDVESLEQYHSIDAVLRGEYEITCKEIGEEKPFSEIKGLTWRNGQGEIIRNEPRPFCEDLDSLPIPARHLVKNDLYTRPDTGESQTTLVTNRGCPFNCIFCLANQVAGKKNRVRSQENILDEIEECVSRYGIRNFLFRSDLFTANKKWVISLCRKIVERGLDISWACNSRVDTIDAEILEALKSAGCWLIAYGVESGDAETLKRMNKKISLDQARKALSLTRKAGIRSSIYFLFGLPWDTAEVFEKDLAFAKEIKPDFLEIFYVYPFPGTQLYEEAVKDGLLEKGEIPKAAYDSPAMGTLNMTKDELALWRKKFLKRFYLRPGYILSTLVKTRSPKVLLNYIKYGFIQMVDMFHSD